MSCPLGKNIHHLRKKNRDLLELLESNSVLLEDRIKKLTHTARTPKRSDKSWQDLPPSPLKRRYESWKARNASGQVSAVLNQNLFFPSPDSSGSETEPEVKVKDKTKAKQKMPAKSPAKRSKANIVISSSTSPNKKKHSLQHQRSKSKSSPPKVANKQRPLQKKKKPCAECYCPEYYIEDNSSGSSSENIESRSAGHWHLEEDCQNKTQNRSTCYNRDGLATRNSRVDLDDQLKTAKVGSFLNYSPESVFLRRLKKQSQLNQIGGLSARGKQCTTFEKSTFTRGAEVLDSDDGEMPVRRKETENRTPPPTPEKRQNRCPCSHAEETASITHIHPLVDGVRRNEDHSHCPCSARKASPPSHCCRSSAPISTCRCQRQVVPGESEREQREPCETVRIDELSRFRRSHWFDCHAYRPSASCTCLDTVRGLENVRGSWFENDLHPHKCVHHYVLNERQFLEPLYADHHNNSRCRTCHLPREAPSKARVLREINLPSKTFNNDTSKPARVVTLPSKPLSSEVIVSLPASTFAKDANMKVYPPSNIMVRDIPPARVADAKLDKNYRKRRPPVPTNSLALRYQKGIA